MHRSSDERLALRFWNVKMVEISQKKKKEKTLLPIFIMRHDHLRPLLLSGLLRSIDDGGVSPLSREMAILVTQ